MMKPQKKNFYIALGLLFGFVLWTIAIKMIDVQAIGPRGSTVGFATLNRLVHNLTGVHMQLYIITDWLGLIPILTALGFAILGLSQWIHRKSIRKIDRSLLALGGFYVAVIGVYAFFEIHVINHRPVLIEGILEASYPSSTTMLVLCVIPTAMMQFRNRIKNTVPRFAVSVVMIAFIAFMVISRLISGVHWFTDIIGGALLSAGLVMLYDTFSS